MGTKNKKSQKTKEVAVVEEPKQPTSSVAEMDTSASEAPAEAIGSSNAVGSAPEEIPPAVHEEEEVPHKKSYRKRKKHYYNALRDQMEFYFGDANLSKDRFLKQLIDKDPYVPLETFLTFNKMKVLTSSLEDIARSLSKSELLELDETQQKVKRKLALPENRNVDEKTLYVEALPSSADHEWVRQIFERFGKVSYISLPKYAKSRKIKEFGFVEFEKEDSVRKAVNVFKEFNGVLSMKQIDPAELVSVKSYIKEQAGEESETEAIGKKISKDDLSEEDGEPKCKKIKIEVTADEGSSNAEYTATSQSESENKGDDKNSEVDQTKDTSKKQRRRRKKKSKSAAKLRQKAELNIDVSYYELKILPKKEWKKLRNTYLNLQREKVAELKRKAWREKQENMQHCKELDKEEATCHLGEMEQLKSSKTPKHKLQKMKMNFYGADADEEVQSKTPTNEKHPQNAALERAPLFSYEPGLIVEVSFLEPCVNVKEYKADMRQYPAIKYIDVKEGAMNAHLRLESAEKAVEFVGQLSCAEYQCKILAGEAEAAYWQKIEKDREQKLNKQVKIPQKRGREKVKKLISKHIRFGDDEQ